MKLLLIGILFLLPAMSFAECDPMARDWHRCLDRQHEREAEEYEREKRYEEQVAREQEMLYYERRQTELLEKQEERRKNRLIMGDEAADIFSD